MGEKMDKLPEFPQKPAYWNSGPPHHPVEYWNDTKLAQYERARADAWESRARLAVEALLKLQTDRVICGEWMMYRDDQTIGECIASTLSAIGPLPEQAQP
jgi:hypothetical protein